jgi:hypothetical protein
MPFTVTEFQPTPNPNALKCILDKAIREREQGPGSFRSAESAASDPVAAALFAVPGVTNLLINENWITVNKDARAEWRPLRAEISRVLAGLP